MREKKNRKIKFKKILILACIIIVVCVALIFLFKGKNKIENKFIGEWTTDGVTIYEFKKDNTGVLKVSLSDYDFTYEIKDDKLYIDFKNEKSEDSEYTYEFKEDKLILTGKYGVFTFKRND